MKTRVILVLLGLAGAGLLWHGTRPETAPAKPEPTAPQSSIVNLPVPVARACAAAEAPPPAAAEDWTSPSALPDHSDEPPNPSEIEAAAVPITEAPARLNALLQDDSLEGEILRAALVRRWTAADPSAVAAWAEQLPAGPLRLAMLREITGARAEQDPGGAMDWVNTLSDSEERAVLSIDLAYETARTNGLAALHITTVLPPGRERDDAISHALRQWADAEAPAAAAWVDTVGDAALRQRLLADLAEVYSQRNPAAAAALVSAMLDPGPGQSRAAVAVVQQWAQTSPAEAARWVEQFSVGGARSDATRSLLLHWAANDISAAAQWVESLPAGEMLDDARAALQHAQSLATVTTAAAAAD